MREKLERLMSCSGSQYFIVGLTAIIMGIAILFSDMKGFQIIVGIIVILIGAGVILFLFVPVYRSEQEQQSTHTHGYIGTVIYDASDPDAAPKTSVENILPNLILNNTAYDTDKPLTKTLSPEQCAMLETVLSTTASNPYGSILHPENPKPVNYGRKMDRENSEAMESEDTALAASAIDETLMQSLSLKEQEALCTLLSAKSTDSYESILHPKNPKPVNYGRKMDREDSEAMESEDTALAASAMDETLMQSLSLKEQVALQMLLSTKSTDTYESVLHPTNPKPVNYGRKTDREGE